MIDKDIDRLKHRVKLGRFREFEDQEGTLKSEFKPFKEVWAEIKPMPFPLNVIEDVVKSQKKWPKCTYLIKIRKNVISGARHEIINAIVWEYKILTNFYSFRQDASGKFLEGLFCEQGREL
jgi:head-tail adaptor